MSITDDEKWSAVVNCDSSYDGKFFYGVKTTGVFCRPSCKSKEPLRENVMFFNNADEAAEFGMRPCKRCRPDLLDYKPMFEITEKAKNIYNRYFNNKEMLNSEIKNLGVSQNRLISLFKHQYGITPVEYCNKLKAAKASELLKKTNKGILDISSESGFGSASSFYAAFKRYYEVSPKEYRRQNV
ncbi:MAG: bifunctional transcriptional activator/DNA repair enzyme AdaA [Solirubrobacterales bacterium]